MRRVLITLALGALAAVGLAAGMAAAGLAEADPPNQGDPDKVLTVASGYVCSATVVPGSKVEGALGTTITVSATAPIVQVTVKSGSKATLVSATWSSDYLSGTITITQDVSNYVVWTCSGTTTTDTTDTTPTTPTDTTPTTPTDTTPTDTTPTTPAETTPTVVPSAPLTPPGSATKPTGTASTKPSGAPAKPSQTAVKGAVAAGGPKLAFTP